MLTLNFDPFPELQTERLEMRRLTAEHKVEFFAMRSNPDLMAYIPRPMAVEVDDVLPTIALIDTGIASKERISWGIFYKADGRLIGTIGYVRIYDTNHRAEVGYMLHHDYQGKGLMQEALQGVLAFGFEAMNLHSIEAVIHPDNIGSRRVVEASNFQQEAYFRDFNFHNGRYADAVVYSLLKPLKP